MTHVTTWHTLAGDVVGLPFSFILRYTRINTMWFCIDIVLMYRENKFWIPNNSSNRKVCQHLAFNKGHAINPKQEAVILIETASEYCSLDFEFI